jgi:hypothetical protein
MPSSPAPAYPDASSWYEAAAATGLRALAARRRTEDGEGRYSGRRSPTLAEDDVPYRRSWSGRVSGGDDDAMASRSLERCVVNLFWSGLDALVCRWMDGCMQLPMARLFIMDEEMRTERERDSRTRRV